MSQTTDQGTTITTEKRGDERVIMLHTPDAPADMQTLEVGRIYELHGKAGFQPIAFLAGLLSPSALRIIADLVESEGA